jgi:hypothetical protein
MQIKFIAIPAHHPDSAEAKRARFIASHRVLAIAREFVQDRANSMRAICITYFESESRDPPARRQPKVDYRKYMNGGIHR